MPGMAHVLMTAPYGRVDLVVRFCPVGMAAQITARDRIEAIILQRSAIGKTDNGAVRIVKQ